MTWKTFFRTYYVPNNAVLTVAGDFEAARALELVERYFGEIPAGSPIPPLPGEPEIAPVLGSTVRERVQADVPLPRVILAFRIPPYTDDAFTAAEVARAVLGTGRASRLYRRLVRERRVAKDVVAYAFPLLTGAAMMLVWATGYPGSSAEEIEAALAAEVEGVADATAAEVERAVALSETDIVHSLERVGDRADLLSMFELYFDDPGRLNGEVERLRSVTPDQIRAFATQQLGPDNRAVLMYEPGEE